MTNDHFLRQSLVDFGLGDGIIVNSIKALYTSRPQIKNLGLTLPSPSSRTLQRSVQK